MKKGKAFLAVLLLWAAASAVVAWGTEPLQWEEEAPELLPPALSEEGEWQDWEEDWNGPWEGGGTESPSLDWEPWVEEEQETPPLWGPALAGPEEPAFPEEEPSPSSVSVPEPPAESSQAPAKEPVKPQDGDSQRDTTELLEEEVPKADLPGILPYRVTEEDLPEKETPLWHRAADPNILWILLVAISLVVLGLRILWRQDDRTGEWEEPDKRGPRKEKWGI